MVSIDITTAADTARWEVGREVFLALEETSELLVPDLLTTFSPDRFRDAGRAYEGVESCEASWAGEYIMRTPDFTSFGKEDCWWRRRSAPIRYLAHMHHTDKDVRGKLLFGWLAFNGAWNGKVDWWGLFHRWCAATSPTVGLLHHHQKKEPLEGPGARDFKQNFLGTSREPSLPNFGWATYLGERFRGEVDAARIAEAGFHIEELADGYIFRVTDDINDLRKNMDRFVERRQLLKSLFREGLTTMS